MSFFKSLFSRKKHTIQDEQLGTFSAFNINGNRVIWQRATEFLGGSITLFISGNTDSLDASERDMLLNVINNQFKVESEAERALKDVYNNAGKDYSIWKDHFCCISISTVNNETVITFEEKDSFYLFNVYFSDNKSEGVSIDS